MKLCVIGGAGARSAFLTKSLVKSARDIRVDHIVLLDNDQQKLKTYGEISRELSRRLDPDLTFEVTSDARAALTGVDYIITTIRAGEDAGRLFDEQTCLAHGVLGQETTGAGGFAMAIRSVPTLVYYCTLAREVANLEKMGVEIQLNMVIGKVLTIPELFDMGYESVFIGSGAGLPMFMKIPGESLVGVYSANEYLTRINLMKAYQPDSETPILHNRKVAVVGGGNVAMDAARCAKRLGAEVHIVYRRSDAELPARAEEVHHAREEGIIFDLLTNPVSIQGDEKGHVESITCIRMELGEPDASGRRSPVPIQGSEFTMEADAVIMALGTSPNPMSYGGTPGLERTRKGCVAADEAGHTSVEGVFAGGDAATGAATVILAMGAGKHAAKAIDEYLKSKK